MSDPFSRHALTGLAALAVAMGIGRFAFTPILPMMQADGVVDVAGGGWLASANYVGYLAGALTVIWLPLSPATIIRLGLAIVGVATLLMGFMHAMTAWIALRGAAGIASAWVLVHAASWSLAQFHPLAESRRAWLGATVFSGVGAGIAISGAICLALLLADARASTAWIALGAVSLAAALALPRGFGASPPRPAGARVAKAPWPGETLKLVACYGAFGFGYIIPATFLAAMARDALRDPAVYGWSWPVFGAAAAVSTFVAASLSRRLAGRRLWAASHVVMAAGVLAPLLVGGMPGIILGALLVGGTFMVATMAGMQEARRIAPSQAPRVIGAMTASFAAGQIAGPLVVSALAARGMGYGPALAGAAALLAVTAFLLLRPATSERLP